jgi:hypothetical protein
LRFLLCGQFVYFRDAERWTSQVYRGRLSGKSDEAPLYQAKDIRSWGLELCAGGWMYVGGADITPYTT